MEMQIFEYSLCLIEYIIYFIFFSFLLEKRYKKIFPLLLVILMGSAELFFCSNLDIYLKTLINLLTLLIGSSILYKDKLYIKLSYSTVILFTMSIIDIIFGDLFALVIDGNYSDVFYSNFTYRLIFCLLIKVVDVAVLLIIQRTLQRIDKNLKMKYWGLFCTVFLVLLATSTLFMGFCLKINLDMEIMLPISIAFFAMSQIVIYFFSEICAGFRRDKRLFALESNYRALEETIAAQSINSENLRKIRHDITKHTANAVALIESGKTDDAITLLKNTGEATETIIPKYNINTGNNVVDAIISSKAALCESKGIMFSYQIEPLEDIRIDTVDLSSLLSNLLDNAIEAAEKTENGYIKIEIFKYKAYYDICVENSFMGKDSISYSGLQLLSTKPDNVMHGYGTQIVEDIARKYDGDSTWNADGEIFKSNVLLKI